MITTIESYTDTSIPFADLCIVGTGAAGLELATQLESSFTSILLLEGGMKSFDWRTQNLSYFKQTGRPIRTPASSQPFDFELAKTQQAHLRQFGGTLNIWGGKWKALDPFDLLPKPYLQESSWPISYEELHAYYQAVAKDYDIEDLLWLHDNPSELPSTITSLPCFNPSIDLLEQTPANSKDKFQERLKNSSVIKLILGANVVNIFLSDSLNHVQHLIVRSLSGHEWHVQAKQFILACGTIENARLLLSSHTQLKKGIGNESDWVGRNLLDHPKGSVGLLFPYDQKDIIEGRTFFDNRNKTLEIGISIHPNLLAQWDLPNHCVNIFPHLHEGRKLAYVVKVYLEQLPNFESRLFLSDLRDELNMPIACLDWKFREVDLIGFKHFIEKLSFLLSSNHIGELAIDPQCGNMDFLSDASHQMGTTRMAEHSSNGVVDANCKVFGIDNLYLAGSSVFPTGGNANPTYTILALARRLASHLKDLPR